MARREKGKGNSGSNSMTVRIEDLLEVQPITKNQRLSYRYDPERRASLELSPATVPSAAATIQASSIRRLKYRQGSLPLRE